MSLFTSLRTSLTGIGAITSQISVVSNNIANASTEGYTQKTAVLSSTSTGGVSVTGYKRTTNDALFNSLNESTSNASYRSTQDGYMDQIKTTLGITGSDSDNPELESVWSSFTSAWSALEADPTNSSLQTAVVNAAQNVVSTVNSISSDIDNLDAQISTDITGTCSDLNSYLSQIADLNLKIASATSSGQDTGSLEDSRDQLILKISSIADIQVMDRDQGQIAIYTDGGYCLLDGTNAQQFEFDGTDVYSTNTPSVSLNGTLTGGSLQAAIDFRATNASGASTDSGKNVLQKLREQLNAFVTSLTTGTSSTDFAYVYNNASGTSTEASTFFEGTSTSDFTVNASLVDGSETVKTEAISDCETALSDSTKSFSAGNLSLTNVSYATIITGILSASQTAASNISSLSTTASDAQSYLKETYSNATGVNSDDQTVLLTTLENAYASLSHVIGVIQTMFDDLENIF
jgi:flagellar hook-associated protein 1 FlgK